MAQNIKGDMAAIKRPAPNAGRYRAHAIDITVNETEKENVKLHVVVISFDIILFNKGSLFTEINNNTNIINKV